MPDDMHDDGLVHGHGWAHEPPPAILLNRPASPVLRPAARAAMEDHYDDGLVHSHGWACGERGSKAHE